MKAKMNLHKLLSMLLALVMVVALIPATTAMAEGPTPEGRTANFVNAPTVALALLNSYKTGTEESTWDVNTNTLTLNGVNFETTADTALSLPEGATIILHGENTITGVGSSDNPYNICYGIFVNNSFLTIKGEGKLTVTGGKSASHSFGIRAYSVKIEGGDVTAIGGTSTDGDSVGISSVSIGGGKLTAKGGTADRNSIGCLGAYMTGGTLIATGETTALASWPTNTNTHWWRTSNSAPYYASSDSNYTWDKSHKYIEMRDTDPGDNITVAKVVNNIAVTFKAPELGATPDYSPEYVSTPENGVKYNEDYPTCTWYKIAKADFKGTDEDHWDEMESGEAIKTGYYYLVEMFLDTNIGYKISETTTGTVNGMPLHNDIYCGENNRAYLCGVFAPLHEHTSGTEWKSDSNNHWHICTVDGCGVIIEDSKAAHTASDWITDTEATATTDGTKHKECTECGYVMETGTIPATGSGEHTHSYGSEWKSNADKHWHECSCGVKDDVAAHSFKWVVDKEATATKKGSKHEECKVCGYERPAVEIPATGSTTKPTDPTGSNPNTGAPDDVPQTGDNSNMILWIVLLLASGLGVTGTVVYSKRKKYAK